MLVAPPRVNESDGAEGRLKSAENATRARVKTAAMATVASARISRRRNKRSGVVINLGSGLMERKMSDFANFLGEGQIQIEKGYRVLACVNAPDPFARDNPDEPKGGEVNTPY